MSIAFETNTSNQIQRSGFVHRMSYKPAIYDSSVAGRFTGDRRAAAARELARERSDEGDSCSSSSIGRNSDDSDGEREAGAGDGEVQSALKGPLDCLEALEEVLPIKRGISSFYSGKSKSFASLPDAESCSSIKDIAKPEDVYTRKRKNLLAHSLYWDKNRNSIQTGSDGGIPKRLANSSRSSSNLVNMAASSGNSESCNSNLSSPSLRLPPLPPNGRRSKSPNNGPSPSPPSPRRNFSPWRSFSLSDLEHAAINTSASTIALINNNREIEEEPH